MEKFPQGDLACKIGRYANNDAGQIGQEKKLPFSAIGEESQISCNNVDHLYFSLVTLSFLHLVIAEYNQANPSSLPCLLIASIIVNMLGWGVSPHHNLYLTIKIQVN